jgi:hypothetical protein
MRSHDSGDGLFFYESVECRLRDQPLLALALRQP